MVELWPQVEARLRAEGSTAYVDDLASDAQGQTLSWGDRDDEAEALTAVSFRP